MRSRARSFVLGVVLSIGALTPAWAFDPATMIAKEIVKSVIKDFIRNRVMDGLRAQMGQCAFSLAQAGLGSGAMKYQATQAGLDKTFKLVDRGVDALPGIPGGGPGVPDSDMAALKAAAAAAKKGQGVPGAPTGGVPGMPNVPSVPAGVPVPAAMAGMGAGGPVTMPMTGSMSAAQMQAMAGGAGLGGGMPAMSPEQMAMIQQMMAAPPLTADETEELASAMARWAVAFPQYTDCSPEDTRVAIRAAAPMAGGAMRRVLDSMRKLDQTFAESRRIFATLSAEAQAEYVELATADLKTMSPEEREIFVGLVTGNLFGMPDPVQAGIKAGF